jgi:hypothetical protein
VQSIAPPARSSSLTTGGGLVSEVVLTFGLVHAVYATAIDPRARSEGSSRAPLAVGLLAGANVMFGAAFSGGVMNPARSFGPALVAWDFTDHWIFWVGPLSGALIATLFYEILLFPRPATALPSQEPLISSSSSSSSSSVAVAVADANADADDDQHRRRRHQATASPSHDQAKP